jgi:hypothetical protein
MSSTKCCPLEKSLCSSKPKKCCKVVTCNTECDPVDCCPTVPDLNPCACEVPMDCCSLAYQRLDKLRSAYSNLSCTSLKNEPYDVTYVSSTLSNYNRVYTRDGTQVVVPQAALFDATGSVADLVGFFEVGSSDTSSFPVVGSVHYDNAATAYNFVQTMRYSMYRDVVCNAADQVLGWFVNPSTRQLQVFQNLTGPLNALALTYTDTLQYYDTLTTLTTQQKQKLVSLNILFDLSIEALRKVNLNPKTEGTIVKVCDKCNQHWLVLVNTADVPSASGYQPGLNGYAIVAVRV